MRRCTDCSWHFDCVNRYPKLAPCKYYRNMVKDIKTIQSIKLPSYPDKWLDNLTYSQAMIVCIGAGPWKEKRRYTVQKAALDKLAGRDIRNVEQHELPWYPLDWQNKMLQSLVKVCAIIPFTNFCEDIQSGNAGVKLLYEKCGVTYGTKVISLFVRDKLKIQAFPIDRWVKRFLVEFELPVKEGFMVNLCTQAGIDAAALNRAIVQRSFSGNPVHRRKK